MCYWQFTPKTAVRDYKYVILGWCLKGTSVDGVFVRTRGGVGVLALVGLGLCRVAAFGFSGLHELDILFITISHCAWRHFISFSDDGEKETEAKKTHPNNRQVSVPRETLIYS
ncbi:hypothetical protein EOS_19510 [Caballeronia mineralivorans PML1(12)]|uniref:Uncharacterized protein n=2 Tax=Caballeronia mineralivorans TaxID=2010198 RepID=A0A0J1CV49_9BURK|nr:hypothetical protein EOS_19510 [Caballeronia mineralivorans PML1(12)]